MEASYCDEVAVFLFLVALVGLEVEFQEVVAANDVIREHEQLERVGKTWEPWENVVGQWDQVTLADNRVHEALLNLGRFREAQFLSVKVEYFVPDQAKERFVPDDVESFSLECETI